MTYKEALKECKRRGFAHAEGEALLAGNCSTACFVCALNWKGRLGVRCCTNLFENCKVRGIDGLALLRLSHTNPLQVCEMAISTPKELAVEDC